MFFFGKIVNRENELATFPALLFYCAKDTFMENLDSVPCRVAEMQGLFGTVSISEKLIQQIWARGDFRRDGMRTVSRRTLEIISAGTWNRLDGPDFLGAEILLDGKRVRGDIEIHFYAEDWNAHAHAGNPLYSDVVLHVVVFPSRAENYPAVNAAKNPMETLLLLPHLKSDIEDYATEYALACVEGRGGKTELLEKIAEIPLEERNRRLREAAFLRWEQKRFFMRRRIEKSPDAGTLFHALMLETLGLRRNREAMARLAWRFSLSTMLMLSPEKLYEAEAGSWRLAGIRPANQPLVRLRQYCEILTENPSWERKLRECLLALPGTRDLPAGLGTKRFRAESGMANLREYIAKEIFAGRIGGTRLDTLLVDAFFPLIGTENSKDLSAWWFHWFLGDAPGNLPKILKETRLATREQPYCNGLFQGILQISLQN